MKRTAIFFLFVATIGTASAFASGQAEGPTPWSDPSFEETSLSGTFTLVDGFPAIETTSGTYSLGAPQARWVAAEIEEGTPLEVSGFLMDDAWNNQAFRGESTGIEGHLRVVQATLNGETYEVAFAPGMRHGGMMHGRGWNSRDGWNNRGGGYGMMGGGPGYGSQGGYAPRGGYGSQGGYAPRGGNVPQGDYDPRDGGYRRVR